MTAPIRQYLAPLDHSRRLIAGIVAAGLVVGVCLAALAPTRYVSEAAIFVSAISSDPTASLESTVDNVDMETEIRIAESRAVAEGAAQRLAGADAGELVDGVTAQAPKGSRVLEISFEANSAGNAQLGAQALAEEYLAFRSDLARQQTTAAREQIQRNIDTIEDELATNPDAVRRTVLQGELSAHQEALAQLSTVVLDAGEVIDDARLPSSPSTIGFLPIVLGALAGAFALAVGLAYLLDNLQRRQDATAEPEAQTAAAVVSPVADVAASPPVGTPVPAGPERVSSGEPAPPGPAASPAHSLEAQEPQPSQVATAAPAPLAPTGGQSSDNSDSSDSSDDSTHNGLVAAVAVEATQATPLIAVDDLGPTLDHLKDIGRSGPVVAAVFDAVAGQAAASVAFSLAWKAAELGARTLVIDVNPQESTTHAVVGQAVAPGLAEVLDGTSDLVDVVRQVSGPRNIALMTAGTPTDTTGWQLGGERFADVVTRVKQHYQVVVLIAGRPTGASSTAVASQADGIVLATTLPAGAAIDDPGAMASVALPAPLLATVSALGAVAPASIAPASAPMS